MGKCVKCGIQTENIYSISANQYLSSTYTSDSEIKQYAVLERVDDYACSKCVLVSKLWVLIFATPAVILFGGGSVYGAMEGIILMMLALGAIVIAIIVPCLIALYQGLTDKRFTVGKYSGSGFLVKYHEKELKERYPGCSILCSDVNEKR